VLDISERIVSNARIVIVVMLVASAVVAGGISMLDTATGMGQFQTDADEAAALDYTNANFSTGTTNSTTALVIVQDENVLDQETLVSMLEYQQNLRNNESVNKTLIRDDSTRSVGNLIATRAIREQRIGKSDRRSNDQRQGTQPRPSLETQIEVLRSLNESQVDTLVTDTLDGNTSQSSQALAFMPDYYDPGSAATNATLIVVNQEAPNGTGGTGNSPPAIEDSQTTMAELAPDDGSMSTLIYGQGIVSTEISDGFKDSFQLVGPLAIAFVLLVLLVVYRDLLDILFGLLGVLLVLVWTLGAMGWFGISFSQPLIVVFVLLIGLSIDYGIHVIMRYREARESSEISPNRAMTIGLGSVGVALVYVTTTTVIGFLSNLTSPLAAFRDLGLASAIGIVATLLVFGVLVPALKIELDAFLEGHGIDRAKSAVGTGAGPVNRLLDIGATLATKAPYVIIIVALLVSSVGVYGATDIEASFDRSDFLAEDPADWLKELPEPIAPGTYTSETAIETLDADFVNQDTTATILVRGNVTDPATLDRFDAARANASDLQATETYAGGEPAITDPITVMDRVAARNESFNATLATADTDGDGVPDENVTAVYDSLYRVAPEDAGNVIYRDDGKYRAIRMAVTVNSGVTDETVRDQMRWVADDIEGESVSAIATGDVIVNQITADQIAETAFLSLAVALLSVLAGLLIIYRITEGSASLGAVTVVPVAFTMAWVLGTMALLDISFNIVTGLITGLTIGLGVDYSIHISERFNQELADADTIAAALHEAVAGTGSALLSSAVTTGGAFAVLLIAVLPFLQTFGLLAATTIVYAFIASVFVLPSLLVVWARFGRRDEGTDTPR
jgi:hydrophobe/amphiphile efflux-3 (HAE3) family protein